MNDGIDPLSRLSPAGDLATLEARVRHDLACLNYPAPAWMPASAADGAAVDVLVVGAGMCGQTVAFALLREGVRNLRIVDRAAPGDEGPWATFARMETLRSPKHLVGPDLGIPSLTFRQWYEARFGAPAWEALHKIPRLVWRDYLLWVRRMAGVPVENGTALLSLGLGDGGVTAVLRGPRGEEVVQARRVVLALGRDGAGGPRRWSFEALGAACDGARVFHASDAIDFAALAGRTVGVLGVGATAFDNAAAALEAGASAATLFARRPHLAQVNKAKGASYPGFLRGFADLPDAERWSIMNYVFDEQVPPPWESVLRCTRHAGFSIRFEAPWQDLRVLAETGSVEVDTPRGTHVFDAVILATGFDVDLRDRPELARIRDDILLWADRVPRDEGLRHPEAARFAWLGPGFELQSRSGDPALSRVHLFNWGGTMSHGMLAGDIPGLSVGVARVADAIVRALFVEVRAGVVGALRAFDEPELERTPYYVPPLARA